MPRIRLGPIPIRRITLAASGASGVSSGVRRPSSRSPAPSAGSSLRVSTSTQHAAPAVPFRRFTPRSPSESGPVTRSTSTCGRSPAGRALRRFFSIRPSSAISASIRFSSTLATALDAEGTRDVALVCQRRVVPQPGEDLIGAGKLFIRPVTTRAGAPHVENSRDPSPDVLPVEPDRKRRRDRQDRGVPRQPDRSGVAGDPADPAGRGGRNATSLGGGPSAKRSRSRLPRPIGGGGGNRDGVRRPRR